MRRASWTTLAAAVLLAASARADEAIDYNRDIRPILAENCFACHGPDSAARKADLRLDRREAAVESRRHRARQARRERADRAHHVRRPERGDAAAGVAQDADRRSRRTCSSAGSPRAPSTSRTGRSSRPTRPAAARGQERGLGPQPDRPLHPGRSSKKHGLQPAPEADRRTLARRLSLDLTGLPPEPGRRRGVRQRHGRPTPTNSCVDRLLASPHWGEHRGRYWLDAARYADTHGIHFDNYREIWAYRDWVIDAFNRNLPFDQFTIEQLAGDLLPNRTLDQQIASGFNRCNITTNEGGAIAEEYLVLYTRDRTETVVAGLARADGRLRRLPRPQVRPAQRSASSTRWRRSSTTRRRRRWTATSRTRRRSSSCRGRGPRRAGTRCQADLADARKQQIDARKQAARADFDKWLATRQAGRRRQARSRRRAALPRAAERRRRATSLHVDGRRPAAHGRRSADEPAWEPGHVAAKALQVQAGRRRSSSPTPATSRSDQAFSFGAWVKLPDADMTGAIVARMDDGNDYRGWDLWLENGTRRHAHRPQVARRRAQGRRARRRSSPTSGTTSSSPTTARARPPASRSTSTASRKQSTSPADTLQGHDPHRRSRSRSASGTPSSRLDDVALQDLRLYGRALAAGEVEQLAGGHARRDSGRQAGRQADRRREVDELFAWWLRPIDAALRRNSQAQAAALEQEEAAIKARGTVAHVMQEQDRAGDGLHPVPRRVRQAPRPGEARHARRPAADARRPAAATASASPSGCCGPSIR